LGAHLFLRKFWGDWNSGWRSFPKTVQDHLRFIGAGPSQQYVVQGRLQSLSRGKKTIIHTYSCYYSAVNQNVLDNLVMNFHQVRELSLIVDQLPQQYLHY